MKSAHVFLVLFLLLFQSGFAQAVPDIDTSEPFSEVHQIIERASLDASRQGYEKTRAILLSAMEISQNEDDKNLIALVNYSLAKLDYDHGKFTQAEKTLNQLLEVNEDLNDQYIFVLSHILLSRVEFQTDRLTTGENHLAEAEKIIVEIGIENRQERLDNFKQISYLSDENSKQQRSLEFSQLKIVMGVTMILVLSLLALALFKNSNIRSRTTSLLRAKNKQLVDQRNKAEEATIAKTEFLSNITHELRTPVYAVTGLTYLLQEENPTEEQKEHLKSLRFSGEHLLGLINNILDFNKLEAKKVALEIRAFNLRTQLENILIAFNKSAKEKNNKLHLRIDADLPEKIIGDRLKLSQVLINLISNAVRFTENGEIWLRAKTAKTSDNLVHIRFEIEDNGVGIPENLHNEIFENFNQGAEKTNSKYGGTGLGLPIVKAILLILGGEIKLESKPGLGSKFYFTLNFEQVPQNFQLDAERKKEQDGNLKKWQNGLTGKKILIVEDNKINQMITQKILLKEDVLCDLVENGESAVEKAASNKYDLILMDINMPGIGGIEATKQIRKADPNIPILALTAVGMNDDLENYLNNGFNDVIPKPFKIEVFFEKIYNATQTFRSYDHPRTS